ncbi:MAG TPA: flagellar hook-associated protein FlgK [Telluria sp.]|nr:flagellar hook-associated protein FlgK [Telluria sp.]
MAGNLFSIGKTALFAAQAGLSTTGHNIANANVVGYSRQLVVQESALAQDYGYGFVGNGTEIAQIKRYSSEFTNTQVRAAQASASAFASYGSQIAQIDNMLGDTTSGLSPALQDFFKSVQNVAAGAGSTASRQALLSSAETLASRFRSADAQLQEIRDGVNAQIESNITVINSYAQQLASLNEKIGAFSNNADRPPNDLLDQRDQLLVELNKHVRATVMPGSNNSMTVSIGSGQPLVVGSKAYQLAATPSATDPMRVQVGYQTGDRITMLADSALQGGELGGLLEFRSQSLDRAQNSIGRIAIAVASAFNDQHQLGWDRNGAAGGPFFAAPQVEWSRANTNNSATTLSLDGVVISDPSKLSHNDYELTFNGVDFDVVRLPGREMLPQKVVTTLPATEIDGVTFNLSGTAAVGDKFVVRPTALGASEFKLLVNDVNKIAAAAPIATAAALSNTGTGKISEGVVEASYMAAQLGGPLTLTVTGATLLADQPVVVNMPDGSTVSYLAGDPIPYTVGDEINIGGAKVTISGLPVDGDKFTIAPNTGGTGDNRNMRLLGQIQTTKILDGGATTIQGAYAELVSNVGNKTREVQVNGAASESLLEQSTEAQQSIAGVNLDEEAANLLKYQQAYQAAGKVMQIADSLFDTLLSIGN